MKKDGLSYRPITPLRNGERVFHRAGNRLKNQYIGFDNDVVLPIVGIMLKLRDFYLIVPFAGCEPHMHFTERP
jgi:hypothetical protein